MTGRRFTKHKNLLRKKGEEIVSETSDRIRKQFGTGDEKRDAGLTTPEDVVRYDDIVYGKDTTWQVLDVYRPRADEGKRLPVIVSVHGGGWVYGDKERYQYYCMSLAQRGFAVVNFTYRLAPEYQFPASLEDTNLVFFWVLEHAKEYGMDAERIFAVGDSAGGHMLSLYTAACTNPEYAKTYPFRIPEGFAPRAVGLNCGVYCMDDRIDGQTKLLMEDLMPEKGTKEELEWICPVRYVTENYPPVFLMTADGDFLKAQAPILAERLAEKGVPFVYRFYAGKKQPLGHVFHCDMKSADAAICNDEECAFFRGYC